MTEAAPDPRLRAWRVALCGTILGGFGLLGGMAALAVAAEAQFKAIGAKALPAPTELFCGFAAMALTPLGVAVATLLTGLCVGIVARGKVDARARDLTLALAMGLVLVASFFALALFLPLKKLHVI